MTSVLTAALDTGEVDKRNAWGCLDSLRCLLSGPIRGEDSLDIAVVHVDVEAVTRSSEWQQPAAEVANNQSSIMVRTIKIRRLINGNACFYH